MLPVRAADVVAMGRFAARGLLRRMGRHDREIVAQSMERMGVAELADRPRPPSPAGSASECTSPRRSPGGPT